MTITGRTASRRWLVPLCLTLLLGGLALPAPAVGAATTRHVTDCGDAGTNTLRGQIAAASAGDTIVFDQNCTITLSQANGTLTLAQDVTIDGSGHTVVVDGGCSVSGGVCTSGGVGIFAVNPSVTASITRLTIQHAGTYRCGLYTCGGTGIDNEAGTVTVTTSTITGDSALQGAGIYNNRGTVTVTSSTLSGNYASVVAPGGAGIFNNLGTVTVTNSTLSGNSAEGGGGGIDNEGGSVTVTNSILTGNDAGQGGGIANTGTLTVTNSTLSGNSATNTGGGGIWDASGGTVTVTASTFSGNAATAGDGGGIFVADSGTVTVVNSTFATNHTGGDGGGIKNNGTATVTNSTFSGNAAFRGGGIANGGTVTVTNDTLAGNAATGGGGGIENVDTLTVTNTIVASSPGGDLADFAAGLTGNNNLIDDAANAAGFTDGVSGNIVGHPALLGTLGTLGGPTQTIPLLPGSPAINAGDDAVCAASGTGKVNGVDQRGIARPQGAHCDIGAFEFIPPPNPLPGAKPPGVGAGSPGAMPGVRPAGPQGGVPNPLPPSRP